MMELSSTFIRGGVLVVATGAVAGSLLAACRFASEARRLNRSGRPVSRSGLLAALFPLTKPAYLLAVACPLLRQALARGVTAIPFAAVLSLLSLSVTALAQGLVVARLLSALLGAPYAGPEGTRRRRGVAFLVALLFEALALFPLLFAVFLVARLPAPS